jgi:phage terminase small subunit
MPLTPLQERFCQEYIIDLNATRAAERAGSKAENTGQAGHEFLKNPEIQKEIERLKLERSEATKIDAQWLLKRLAAEADADVADIYDDAGNLLPVKDWPPIWRKGLVQGIDIEVLQNDEGEGGAIIKKIRVSDRIKRLELIGKHVSVQAFQENVNHTGLDALAERLERASRRDD